MATFTKRLLSGSTNGLPIEVDETSSPGELIHATGTSATVIDEIWLYAANNDSGSADLVLTIEFGGTSGPEIIAVEIPFEDGLTLVVPGLPLTGDGSTATEVRAFAPAGISISGYVNRIA